MNIKTKKTEQIITSIDLNESNIKKKLRIKNDLLVKKLKVALLEKNKVKKALLLKKKLLKQITIVFRQNNIFCSLINLSNTKTLHLGSSGIYKIKMSKRKLKHLYTEVLNNFFNKIKRNIKNFNNTIFNIVLPKHLRKNVFKLIHTHITEIKNKESTLQSEKKNILICLVPKTCYNGCQAKKNIKKKRKLFRIYK
jgi:hypothetical protein